jgi:tRNA 2-thiouridine synthesizing protein A
MTDALLDAKGLNCPLPVLRAKKMLARVAPGACLRVLATDPGAVPDFQSFCRQGGHVLETWSEAEGVFSFLIRRGA